MLLQENTKMYSLVSPSPIDILQDLDDMSWSSSDDSSSYDDDDSTSAFSASTASMEWTQDSFRDLDISSIPSALKTTSNPLLGKSSAVSKTPISLSGSDDIPKELLRRIQNAQKCFGVPSATLSSVTITAPAAVEVPPAKPQSPQDLLTQLLKSKGVNPKSGIKPCDLYVQLSQENVKAFTMNKTTAIRQDNVDALKEMHGKGEMLLCCTQFGESILHIACRKGSIECVKYLVQDLGLPTKLADDYQKNLFHDACWTSKPNFEIAQILLDSCPELLLMPDKRGFFPLQYVPRDNWSVWCEFLNEQVPAKF